MSHITDVIHDSLVKRDVKLIRVEAGLNKSISKQLNEAQDKIIAVLNSIDPTSWKRYQTQLNKTNDVIGEIEKILKEANPVIYATLMEELRSVAIYGVYTTIRDYNKAFGADVFKTNLTRSQIGALATNSFIQGAEIQKLVKKLTVDTQNRIGFSIRNSIINGEDLSTITRNIRGKRENNFRDGILAVSTRSAKTLIRSSINTIMSNARMQTAAENADVIESIQHLSTLDLRTSDICRARDNLTWTYPDLEPIDHNLPFVTPGQNHPNCRSTALLIPKKFKDMPKRVQNDIPEKTRASIDGQVPRSMNYEEFLRGRSVEEQKEILGPTKYRLWSEEKITMQDLLNEDGRPLSVSELLKEFD